MFCGRIEHWSIAVTSRTRRGKGSRTFRSMRVDTCCTTAVLGFTWLTMQFMMAALEPDVDA
jgi:hypothetical protein